MRADDAAGQLARGHATLVLEVLDDGIRCVDARGAAPDLLGTDAGALVGRLAVEIPHVGTVLGTTVPEVLQRSVPASLVVEVPGGGLDVTVGWAGNNRAVAVVRRLPARDDPFRGAFAGAGVGMALVSVATGRFLAVNDALCRLLGRPAEELVGSFQVGVVLPDEAPDEASLASRLLDTGEPSIRLEQRWVTAAGDVRTVAVTASLAAGRSVPDVALLLVDDVTAERRATEALLSRQARLRLMAVASPAGIFLADGTGRTFEVNERFTSITGLEADQVGRLGWLRLVPAEDRRSVAANLRSATRGRRTFAAQFRIRRPDGAQRWVSVRATAIEHGAAAAVIGSVEDITTQVAALDALARRESEYRLLAENATDLISRHAPDGTFLFASPASHHVLGIAPDRLVGHRWFDRLHPDDVDPVRDAIARLDLEGGAEGRTIEYRAQRADDTWGWFESSIRLMRSASGTALEMLAVTRRIDSRKAVEADLREAEERFRRAFEDGPIGMALIAPDGQWLQANRALCRLLERDQHDLRATTVVDVTHPADRSRVVEEREALLAGRVATHQLDLRLLRPDGGIVWSQISESAIRADDGTVRYTMCQVADLTARRQYEARLAHMALHDPLTGLPNRNLLLDRLEHALSRSRRSGVGLGLLFLDLDRFKVVNDSLGHDAGDELLEAVAKRVTSVLRPGDTAARFGGDEFVILCEDLPDIETALSVAERLLGTFVTPFDLADGEVVLTASIGIALPTGDTHAEDLMRDADAAMYRAKERGRARIEIFDTAMRARAVRRLRLEGDLRRAMETQGGLRLAFQPTIDVATGGLAGAEVLLRWDSPDGPIPPDQFIPVAEEVGLIVPLGAWVLERACRQAAAWRRQSPQEQLVIAVNLSARQLSDAGLVDEVADILAATGCPADALCLEITESVLMEDAAAAVGQLRALKHLGVALAVDDFGTGYSSLNYLKRFPVDLLKVDRGFVDGLGTDPEDSAIVVAVIGLAHALGLRAVAEGVETELQASELRRLGCDLAQGYLWDEPGPPERIEARLGDGLTTR